MNKLLSAGFSRLWRNKFFWLGMILLPGLIVCSLLDAYHQMIMIRTTPMWSDFTFPLDNYLYGCFLFIGIFTSVFAALFLGTEYSDGTVRNKLVVGHSRTAVYLSSLTVCFVSSLLVCLVSAAITFALGIPLFGTPETSALVIIQKYACGVLMITSLSGLFTLLAMMITSKPASAIICTIGIFALFLFAVLIIQRLLAPEMVEPGYEMSVNGEFIPLEPYPNPRYLTGTARRIYELLRDLLPTGMGIQLSQFGNLENPLQACLCSLLVTAATTAGGILAFQKKNLK